MKIDTFWLKQSNLLLWYQKPSIAYTQKKNNYVDWYPDGKINIFENCVSKNIKLGFGKKIAIYCVNKNKQIKSYTYDAINKKVSLFSNILISQLKNKKISSCRVMIHASASIESSISMLSCAKLGIHFSVIFEDLAPEAIITRISIFKPDIFLSRFKKKKIEKTILKKQNSNNNTKFLFFDELKYLNSKKN